MNWKQLYFPDTAISFRLRAAKNWLALGMFASSLIFLIPVLFQKDFISVPLFNDMASLHPLAFKVCIGIFGILPLFILISRKPVVLIVLQFLLGIFLLVFHTPLFSAWIYQYLVLFFVLMFYNWRVDEPKKYTPVFNTLKICIVLFCVWSGTEKLLTDFNGTTWPWMLSAFDHLLTPAQIGFLKKAGYVLPVAEILAGFALLLPTVKRIAIPVLFLTHLLWLLANGPLGHSVHPELWPAHFTGITLIYVLFAGKTEAKPYQWSFTLSFKPAYVALLLLLLAPAIFFSRTASAENAQKEEETAVGLPLTSLLEALGTGSSDAETGLSQGLPAKQNRK